MFLSNNTIGQKYFHNTEYFSIPTVENCYWAGFIAADGCILRIKNEKDKISFSQNSKDIIILENFAKAINFTGKINTQKLVASLVIGSAEKLSFNLNKYFNITPRKSLTLQPPNITDIDLCLPYIIGVIDGDGCINIKKDKYHTLYLGIVGTKELLEWINKIFNNIGKLRKRNKYNDKNTYDLRFHCTNGYKVLKILESIIIKNKLENLVLRRKWDKIQQYEKLKF